jgi:hypothetical protein
MYVDCLLLRIFQENQVMHVLEKCRCIILTFELLNLLRDYCFRGL